MAEKALTNAQLTAMVKDLADKLQVKDQEIAELKEARAKKGGSYQRKIREGVEYVESGIRLTWIQALVLDHLMDKVNAVTITGLASGCNAIRHCDVENGIGRIKYGDSGLEAQFRAVLPQMELKKLVSSHRVEKLAYKITPEGEALWATVQRDIAAGGLNDLFLYAERVTPYAWQYFDAKYGKKEDSE